MSAISRDDTSVMASAEGQRKFLGLEVNVANVVMWAVLIFFIFITIFPFWWVLRTALTSPSSIFTDASALLPPNSTTDNFARVLGILDPRAMVGQDSANISVGTLNFWLFLRNSVLVATLVTVGQTFFSALAAYAFARLKFPFRDLIFFFFLTGLMVPSIVLFIPNFVLVRQLGLIGSISGIVAPTFFMTPFAVFFMRQFFISLNKDLEEAAKLDGLSIFGIFWRIAIPLTTGPLFTLALLTFIGSWNDYLWPLLVGRDEQVRVLTVALGVFRQQTPQGAPDWAGLMAGALVSIVPTLLLFVFFGRRVVDSIQFSGFK
jgi:multiple sugar transport system permease protein